MSSIDDSLKSFYLEQLVPVAAKLHDEGIAFFPRHADDELTWYEPPPTAQDLVEFDMSDFGSELAAMWRTQGYADLVPLAEPLFELAKQLQPEADGSDDVSPFMYVMF